MDFEWSAAQRALYDSVVEFAGRELNPELRSRDAAGRFDREGWSKCARFGLLGLFVPEDLGGGGHDVLSTMLALEGLGYGCRDNGLTLALNGQMWSVQEPILRFGTPEQRRRFLPGLCGGEILGAHAMSEEGSGSDAFSLQTRAEKRGDGWVLNGRKCYIGLGPVCDLALVFARSSAQPGRWGISAFLVEADTPGFHRLPVREKMGLRTAPLGDLVFEDCRVPHDGLLGRAGAGAGIFGHSMEWERSFIFASHVGRMARQLEETVAHARERRQFGQPIGRFQSVSNRVADMKLRLETARLLLYKAAWLKDAGKSAALESALAKLHLAECFLASSLDAVRVHGAKGYLSEFEVERDLRDATGGVIYSGTSDIQREIVARLLGL